MEQTPTAFEATRYYTNGKYIETELETLDNHGHGQAWTNFYAEVRYMGQQGAYNHGGIAFYSVDNGASDTTGGHYEFDLLEQYGPGDQFDHFTTHIWAGNRTDITSSANSNGIARPENKQPVDWHVYGLLATPSYFVWFRDGVAQQYIQRSSLQQTPAHMAITLFGNWQAGAPNPSATSIQIDYVHVYTPKP